MGPLRERALAAAARVREAPERHGKIDLNWLMKRLGKENVLSLLIEGGGEVSASFFGEDLVHEIAFFYGPKIIGGDDSHAAIAGFGVFGGNKFKSLKSIKWRRLGPDLLLTAKVVGA